MPSPTEIAVRTYAAAWEELDPAERARMIDACFATDGRIATTGDGIRGRAALAAAIAEFRADPRGLRVRIAGAIDIQGRRFRFHTVIEHRDGTVANAFDAGEVDADGRIAILLAFGGSMPEGPA
jgi:hypothetical protein